MDTFGLGSPNCFVVNLSSLVRRLKRSFCQRANRVIALDRAAILTEYASVEAVWRSYRLLHPLLMTRRGGASPPGSHRECIESSVLWKKNVFNMGVNGRGLGRFSFRPKSPRKGGAIWSTTFALTAWLLPDWTMIFKGRSDGLVVESDRKKMIN